MVKYTGKHKQWYVDHPSYQLKLTCLIHGLEHSPDERKVLSAINKVVVAIHRYKCPRQIRKLD